MSNRWVTIAVFLFFGVIRALPAAAAQPEAPAAGYNIILVSLDTLRPDHLGCYGYDRDTSPAIDAISRQGALFRNAFAQSNFTLSSHASLFTSKYVRSHNVDRIERRLSESETTIAEVMRANGYKTAAFIHNAQQFDPKFGLNQGFESYNFAVEPDRRISFSRTLPQCLDWIDNNQDKKFFVFLHSNDIHEPYHCPDENRFDPAYKGGLDNEYLATWPPGFHARNLNRADRDIRHITAHYDAGIRYADGFAGVLFSRLAQKGLLKKTILVFFSDHGEILGNREKRFCHGFGLHDDETRVALLFYLADSGKQDIQQPVELIDIMPTLLGLTGISAENLGLEGKDLSGLIRGKDDADTRPREYIYAESLSGESDNQGIFDLQAMVRDSRWKLITHTWKSPPGGKKTGPLRMHNGAIIKPPFVDYQELYDLEKDPGESRNLAGKGYDAVQNRLLTELLNFL